MLTIVIPIKSPLFLDKFLRLNNDYLQKYPVIVVDSGGGEKLSKFSRYLKEDLSLSEARKLAYSFVETPYVLNLDVDVIIPENYIAMALAKMEADPKIGAISIFFEGIGHRGILEYGISIWRTEIVKKLYDYNPVELRKKTNINIYCECLYMWEKLLNAGYRLETLPIRAKHLK